MPHTLWESLKLLCYVHNEIFIILCVFDVCVIYDTDALHYQMESYVVMISYILKEICYKKEETIKSDLQR